MADELLPHLKDNSINIREEIIDTLLSIIETNEYQNVESFEWLFENFKLMITRCPPSCEKRLANIIQVI